MITNMIKSVGAAIALAGAHAAMTRAFPNLSGEFARAGKENERRMHRLESHLMNRHYDQYKSAPDGEQHATLMAVARHLHRQGLDVIHEFGISVVHPGPHPISKMHQVMGRG